LAIQQHQQQPQWHRRRLSASGGGRSVSSLPLLAANVGRDTLRSAADATWQSEMNFTAVPGSWKLRVVVLVSEQIAYIAQ